MTRCDACGQAMPTERHRAHMTAADNATRDALDRMAVVIDRASALVGGHAVLSRRPSPETSALVAHEFAIARMVENALNATLTPMANSAQAAGILMDEMEALLGRGDHDRG